MLPNEVFALQCRDRYAEDGLVVDKSNGQFAHCPLPESMGDNGYYLLWEDHQWQGLLQSKDVGRRCYYTYEVKRWLISANFVDGWFDLWDIYDEFNRHPEEHKRKLSEVMKGVPKSEETRRRMSKARKGVQGKPLSKEHKRKIGEQQVGVKNHAFGKFGEYHHSSKAVIVTNNEGDELWYGGVAEAKRELNANQSIFKYLKTGKMVTRGKFKGWKFKYV